MRAEGPIVLGGVCGLGASAAKIVSGVLLVEAVLDGVETPLRAAAAGVLELRREGLRMACLRTSARVGGVSLAQHLEGVRRGMSSCIEGLTDPCFAEVVDRTRARLARPDGVADVDVDRLLEDIFGFAVEAANGAYRAVVGSGGIVAALHPEVACRPRAKAVSFRTVFPAGDAYASRRCSVEVELPEERVTPEQVFGLPVGVVHEVFAHVAQAWDAPGRRQAFGNDCPFGEGFADAAASAVRVAAFEHGLAGYPSLRPFARRFAAEAVRLGAERLRAPSCSDDGELHVHLAREMGNSAFDAMFEALGGGEGAQRQAPEIAAALNTLDIDKGERRMLVRSIRNGLSSSSDRLRFETLAVLTAFPLARDLADLRRILRIPVELQTRCKPV